MKILALDTTQEYCSAALAVDGDIRYREEQAPRAHTSLVLPQIRALLDEAGLMPGQLDVIAYGRGPGSFTGLRIAAGVAQGLALGADLPVAPVSSLQAMAQGVYRNDHTKTRVCAAFDARINEIYWGCYELREMLMQAVIDESVDRPEDVVLPASGQWLAIGSGWQAYPQLQQRLGNDLSGCVCDTVPLARDIIPFAAQMLDADDTVAAEEAIPVYLRHKVAQTVAERRNRRD